MLLPFFIQNCRKLLTFLCHLNRLQDEREGVSKKAGLCKWERGNLPVMSRVLMANISPKLLNLFICNPLRLPNFRTQSLTGLGLCLKCKLSCRKRIDIYCKFTPFIVSSILCSISYWGPVTSNFGKINYIMLPKKDFGHYFFAKLSTDSN